MILELDDRAKLVAMIRLLRHALDLCAVPDEGWPDVEVADIYEASRRLVPDMPADTQ